MNALPFGSRLNGGRMAAALTLPPRTFTVDSASSFEIRGSHGASRRLLDTEPGRGPADHHQAGVRIPTAAAAAQAAVAGTRRRPPTLPRRRPRRRRPRLRLRDLPVPRPQQRFLPPRRDRPAHRPRPVPDRRRSLRLYDPGRLLDQYELAVRPDRLSLLRYFGRRRHDLDRPQGADDRRPRRGDAAHRPRTGTRPLGSRLLRRPGAADAQPAPAAAADLRFLPLPRRDVLAAAPAAANGSAGGGEEWTAATAVSGLLADPAAVPALGQPRLVVLPWADHGGPVPRGRASARRTGDGGSREDRSGAGRRAAPCFGCCSPPPAPAWSIPITFGPSRRRRPWVCPKRPVCFPTTGNFGRCSSLLWKAAISARTSA